jgi:hypothetical protein
MESVFGKMMAEKVTKCKDPAEAELMGCVAQGFDLRGKWGQRFSRDAVSKSEAYKKLKIDEKAQFRKDWAATKLDEIQKKQERSESYQRIDASKGTYLPFFVLWQKEGGPADPLALGAAIKHATKCVAMGGPWVSVNMLTERVEFLHLERSVSEVFTRCWTLYEIQVSTTSPTAADSSSMSATGDAGVSAAAVTAGKGQKRLGEKHAENKGAATIEKPEKPEKPEKQIRTKSPVEMAFADASEVKKLMAAATTSARSILESVEADKEWKNLAGASDPLRNTVKALQAAMTPFARAFLSLTTMQVKKDYPDANTLKTELQHFTCAFKDIVASCDFEARKLVAMQQAAKSLSKKS